MQPYLESSGPQGDRQAVPGKKESRDFVGALKQETGFAREKAHEDRPSWRSGLGHRAGETVRYFRRWSALGLWGLVPIDALVGDDRVIQVH